MKTIAYIDGGNLYHGLLRRCPRYKWLDVAALYPAKMEDYLEAFPKREVIFDAIKREVL